MRLRYQIPISWKKSPFLSKSIEIRSCADITSHSAHVCVFSSEVLILFLKLFILGFPGMLAESKSYALLATPFSPSIFLCTGKPLSLNSRTSVGHCPSKERGCPYCQDRITSSSTTQTQHYHLYAGSCCLSRRSSFLWS